MDRRCGRGAYTDRARADGRAGERPPGRAPSSASAATKRAWNTSPRRWGRTRSAATRALASPGTCTPRAWGSCSSHTRIPSAPNDSSRAGISSDSRARPSPTKASCARKSNGFAARGYALAMDTNIPGVSALAAPVLDASGRAVAALTLAAPTPRFDAMRKHTSALVRAAQTLGHQLSAPPARAHLAAVTVDPLS